MFAGNYERVRKVFLPQFQTSFCTRSRNIFPSFPTALRNPVSQISANSMEVSVISDAITSIAYSAQSSSFSNFLLHYQHNVLSLSDISSDQPSQSPPSMHISATSRPSTRTLTRRRLRKTRRVKRKIGGDNEGGRDGFFIFSDGGDFSSGGGYFGSGGGGKGWNFGGYGGWNWEDFSDNSISDPAFDIVYEILSWIAMSNCLHFAFKKVVRFVADGVGDREKVQMPLTPVC